MAVSLRLNLDVQGREVLDSPETHPGSIKSHVATIAKTLRDGTGSGQIDLLWSDERSLSASGNEDIDLAGSLTDFNGGTITGTEMVFLMIVNKSTTAGDILTVGPASSNGFGGFWTGTSPTNTVGPGQSADFPGFIILNAPVGLTITAGTGDLITITETGGSNTVTYQIIIGMRSA